MSTAVAAPFRVIGIMLKALFYGICGAPLGIMLTFALMFIAMLLIGIVAFVFAIDVSKISSMLPNSDWLVSPAILRGGGLVGFAFCTGLSLHDSIFRRKH